jgi:hypothetical protein
MMNTEHLDSVTDSLDMPVIKQMNRPVCYLALLPSATTDIELHNPEKPEQQHQHYDQ